MSNNEYNSDEPVHEISWVGTGKCDCHELQPLPKKVVVELRLEVDVPDVREVEKIAPEDAVSVGDLFLEFYSYIGYALRLDHDREEFTTSQLTLCNISDKQEVATLTITQE